jgi:uncharacterized beta-barrel protein YwiB (DUF1934 family)
MQIPVMLTIRGSQSYADQEPDIIELVTEGTLEKTPDGWVLGYDESSLTGLEGVHTTFTVDRNCVTLSRTGKLRSTMVFREGVAHDSLYEMEFGALMITVCATKIRHDLSEKGGVVDLKYSIEIEKSTAGTVDYHLKIRRRT